MSFTNSLGYLFVLFFEFFLMWASRATNFHFITILMCPRSFKILYFHFILFMGFFIFFLISSLTHLLFSTVLFNLHVFMKFLAKFNSFTLSHELYCFVVRQNGWSYPNFSNCLFGRLVLGLFCVLIYCLFQTNFYWMLNKMYILWHVGEILYSCLLSPFE